MSHAWEFLKDKKENGTTIDLYQCKCGAIKGIARRKVLGSTNVKASFYISPEGLRINNPEVVPPCARAKKSKMLDGGRKGNPYEYKMYEKIGTHTWDNPPWKRISQTLCVRICSCTCGLKKKERKKGTSRATTIAVYINSKWQPYSIWRKDKTIHPLPLNAIPCIKKEPALTD